jgi:tetratricopeptide (TPR) repeat protein/glycosyltransferase involved in cell wall biosynthesis
VKTDGLQSSNTSTQYAKPDEVKPEIAAQQLQLGHHYFEQGQFDQSIACYRHALVADPTQIEIYQYLAETLSQVGKLAEAAACYRKAIELTAVSSKNVGSSVENSIIHPVPEVPNQQWIELNCEQERGSAQSIHRSVKQMVNSLPNGLRDSSLNGSCNHASNLSESYNGKIPVAEQEPDFYLNQAEHCYGQGRWQDTVAYCRYALQAAPTFSAYKLLGNALQRLEQFAEAANAYLSAMQLEPQSAEIYANLGSLYAQQQRWQDAVVYYQSAIALKPDFAGVYRNLARVWIQLEESNKATDCWYHAFTLEPEQVSAEEQINLGNLLLGQNRIEAAIDCYRQAIHRDPMLAGGYQNLATALFQQGKTQEAEQFHRKAQELGLTAALIQEMQQNCFSNTEAQVEIAAAPTEQEYPEQKHPEQEQEDETLVFSPIVSNTETLNQLEPESMEACCKLAESFQTKDQLVEVIRASTEALKRLEPEMVQTCRQLAESFYEKNDLAEAIRYYQRVVELEPDSAADRVNLGSLYAQQQQWQDAIVCYQNAIALDANLASAHWNLAKVWEATQQPEQAAASFLRALTLEPSWASLSEHLTLGHTLRSQGNEEATITCYQQVIQRDTTCAEAYAALGAIFAQQQQWQESANHYQQALQHNPKHIEALVGLGQILAATQQWQQAITIYRQVVQLEPQPLHYLSLAQWLEQQESWDEAIECYQTLSSLQPGWQIYHKLGDLFNQQQRWNEAITAFRQAIDLNPEYSWSHNNLGDALMRLGQWQEAAQALQQAIALHPDFHWSHYNLGDALAKLEQWDGAVGAYQRAKQLQPDLPDLIRKLNRALHQRAMLDLEAVFDYQCQAIEQDPTNLESLQEALELQPNNPKLCLGLANALAEHNRVDEASVFYQMAIQLQPDLAATASPLKQFLEKPDPSPAQEIFHRLIDDPKENNRAGLPSETQLHPMFIEDPINQQRLEALHNQREQLLQTAEQVHFPTLEDFVAEHGANVDLKEISKLRLCIVTPDFVGFVRNGGIGTSFYHTAQIFSQAGAAVTVVYCNKVGALDSSQRDTLLQKFAAEGIEVQDLLSRYGEEIANKFYPNDIFTVSSYLVYRFLKANQHKYDVILFPEWRGIGYYSILAKRQGLTFEHAALCVQVHSSSLWHALNNQAEGFSETDIHMFQMERGSVQYADYVISPTQYLLNWKQQHGFKLPSHTYVQPYLLNYKDVEREVIHVQHIDEIVFFGRLEKRKGIHHFINAIKKVEKSKPLGGNLKVTFLGKFSTIEQSPVLEYITENLKDCYFDLKILSTLNHEEAIDYLRSTNSVAFIGSVADNSPLTVLECLHYGIPFIASDVGGIPELIDQEYHSRLLFKLHPTEIAKKISEILAEGHIVVPPKTIQAGDNIPVWLTSFLSIKQAAGHQEADTPLMELAAIDPEPLVSICITHYNREALLRKTFEGLEQQSFKNFEVIVVDDGSTDKGTKQFLEDIAAGNVLPNCQVIYQENQYVGAARNKALVVAKAPYLIFMDDDNYARPNQIEVFVKAMLHSDFDALTCFAIAFSEDLDPAQTTEFEHIFLPLGYGLSAGLLQNSYGDANGIFKRSVLEEVGGFSEDYGISWEDHELFAKLDAEGYQVGVVPEPLMWLRSTKGSVSRRGSMVPNYYRILRPLFKHFPWHNFGDALLLTVNQILQRMHQNEARHFGPAFEPRNLLLNSSETGYVAIRHATAYLVQQGKLASAEQMLFDSTIYGHTTKFLLWDWACLQIKQNQALSGLKTLKACADTGQIDVQIAEALLNWHLQGNPMPLLESLKTALVQANPDSAITYKLELGRLYVYCGIDLCKAIFLLGTCLESVEETYVTASSDLGRGIELGHLISGINHYINFGRDEGRVLSYYASVLNPFVDQSKQAKTIHDYRTRFATAFYASDRLEKTRHLSQLLKDCLSSNAVLETFEVCRTLLQTAEADYLDRYEEIRTKKAGENQNPYFGVQHYIMLGRHENRYCLLNELNSAEFLGILKQHSHTFASLVV